MYARVQYQNKIYYSYVFAYFDLNYMPQYVVYNSLDEKFEIVALFSKSCYGHRQIGLMNESEKDFINVNDIKLIRGIARKCMGYPWLVNNINLLNDIDEGKLIDDKYSIIALELNETIDPNAWNEIETEEDAIDFMNHVGGFHDWYLVSLSGVSDYIDCNVESKLQLRFTSQAAFDVLVEFEGGIYLKYGFYTCNRIYQSTDKTKKQNTKLM